MAEVKRQKITDRYSAYNGDCVNVLKGLSDDSVHFSIYSPPFASLYSYSDADEDMGNCRSYEEFFVHFSFLVKQLKRVMVPGRIVAVHCMDICTFKSKDGSIGLNDFPGDIIRLFKENEFTYASRVCIWKDPLIAATRTHAIGLAHKQIVKDSSQCRNGLADYIVAFQKLGDNPIPIEHPRGLLKYVGQREIPREYGRYEGWSEQKTNKRSHWIWQQYASPVWDDIRQTRVLPYKEAKEQDDERHLCPLQLDVIERCLILWSNPGEIVLSPFMGVGSEIYTAVECGRKGIGVELKTSYYKQALRNLESLDRRAEMKGFDT
jgi:DNA modification methylase